MISLLTPLKIYSNLEVKFNPDQSKLLHPKPSNLPSRLKCPVPINFSWVRQSPLIINRMPPRYCLKILTTGSARLNDPSNVNSPHLVVSVAFHTAPGVFVNFQTEESHVVPFIELLVLGFPAHFFIVMSYDCKLIISNAKDTKIYKKLVY